MFGTTAPFSLDDVGLTTAIVGSCSSTTSTSTTIMTVFASDMSLFGSLPPNPTTG